MRRHWSQSSGRDRTRRGSGSVRAGLVSDEDEAAARATDGPVRSIDDDKEVSGVTTLRTGNGEYRLSTYCRYVVVVSLLESFKLATKQFYPYC